MTSEELITRRGELEQRSAEISAALETPEADLDALESEARGIVEEIATINAQLEELRKAAEEAEETRKAVAEGAGKKKEEFQEGKNMDINEIRSSKEYVAAYAEYVKSIIRGEKADDSELRKLMTDNVETYGQVPVPTMVDDIVRTAWEDEKVLARVRKTYFKGNVKVAFERSADPAYNHAEGSTAPTEEALLLGIVTLLPENIKKWIYVTDEMMEATPETFLDYVYREIAHQVMAKLSKDVVGDIANCAYTSHQATAVGIPVVNKDPGAVTIATALGKLSDEARNIVILMNPETVVAFKAAAYAANYPIDVFEGKTVIETSALPVFASASDNACYAIVGDLEAEQVNFPAGDGMKLITDPYTKAEEDLVKIVGRVFAGHGVTAPGRLVRLTKEAAATTT